MREAFDVPGHRTPDSGLRKSARKESRIESRDSKQTATPGLGPRLWRRADRRQFGPKVRSRPGQQEEENQGLAHRQSPGCQVEGPLLRPIPCWRQRSGGLTVGQAHPPASNAGAYHVPVLVAEVTDIFRPLQSGLIVDATFGGGGHSNALLNAIPDVEILGIDRDPDARAMARTDDRLRIAAGNFVDLDRLLQVALSMETSSDELASDSPVAGVLFDLGVSSHQLDAAERGFSYRRAGPLDMRMDRRSQLSADDVVNRWPESELVIAFRRFGEERFARRIAAAILLARPIGDTAQLAAVIAEAVPAPARRRRHPARRVFQAIRIAVNDELDALESGLDAALEWVRPKGRVAVISYHSLEDRIVKRRFAAGTAGCECPPGLPVCTCGHVTELRSLTRRGVTPSQEEVERNPRARSARLRAVEKVAS